MSNRTTRPLRAATKPFENALRKLPFPVKDRIRKAFPGLPKLSPPKPGTKKQPAKPAAKPQPEFLSGNYTNRIPVQDMVNRLNTADAVSFDIFDTLIFRPFRDPREIFSILEIELNHPGFRSNRIRAEKEARDLARELSGGKGHEVTLREIYEHMHRIDGIGVDAGVEAEMRAEMRYVRANPYMMEIVGSVLASGKQVAFTSDMYMTEPQIRQLLGAAGINHNVPVFVSSEHGISKRNGGLYDIVRAHFTREAGRAVECAHIGDNFTVDVKAARVRGWTGHFYQNIHSFSEPAWLKNCQMLRGSAVLGMIDIKFANITKTTGGRLDNYALGYRYAGPMTLAFVDWITRRARELQLDQLIFLSRDGYLPHAVYQLVGAEVLSSYLPWSRAIGLSAGASTFKSEWIRQFVARADEAGFETAQDLLDALGVSFDPAVIEKYLVRGESALRGRPEQHQQAPIDVQALERMFQENWGEVLPQIQASAAPTVEALKRIVTGSRIGVIDIGWAGTGVLTLKSVLDKRHVQGLHFGAFRHQRFGALLEDGMIESFVFDSNHNFAVRNAHAKRPLFNNTLMEVLMGAPYPTVTRLGVRSDTDVTVDLGLDAPEEHEATRQIIAGALDFVTDYLDTFREGPQLRDIADGTIGEIYLDLERNRLIRGVLEEEFPSKFHGVPIIGKART